MQEDYCLEDAAGLPEGTDFCVIAESDCMEPYIKRGGRVCVSRKQTPAEGEAGLFLWLLPPVVRGLHGRAVPAVRKPAAGEREHPHRPKRARAVPLPRQGADG